LTTGPENSDIIEEARRRANDARSILRLLETIEFKEEAREKVIECIAAADYVGLKKILYTEDSYTDLRRQAQILGVKNYSRLSYIELEEAIADEEALSKRIAEAERNVLSSFGSLSKNKKGGCSRLPDEYLRY